MKRRTFTLAVMAGAARPGAAIADDGAPRSITIHVPFPPGGASDLLARLIAPRLEAALARTVVVENTPGASGTLCAQRFFAAKPDGRALMVVSSSETILPPLMMASARYQAEDFRLLAGPMFAPVGLLARPGLGIASLRELLAHQADGSRPPLSYGSLGHGSIAHLAAEDFARLTRCAVTHVPYRGGAPLLHDLVGDQLDLAFLPLAGPVLQLVDAGKVGMLGVAATQRLPHLARHPLLTATPLLAGFVHAAWSSIAVSHAVPQVTALRLNRMLGDILQEPELRARLEREGTHVPAALSLTEAESFYAREIASTRALARAIKLQGP